MAIFFTVLLVISCLILIISILMQSGRSAGLSGAIGGGAEQLFGKSKAKGYEAMFDKITKFAAAAFIVCSLLVAILQ
ncbi:MULTISPECIES: preprotein translocase subunit SecG [unclassified Fusibacter]|uniref:preprotein translocase subunit SecG n=1 Tax=unclassified Fusibacter TaxID=2624464 RepID=UPI00101371D4|nr:MULTISPECIES: preprotein translocase subunit SecG [unclassified Fusibacter]MCK8059739.1 preprotein translocase subunit SecG [Fusibacter sp. A2]NPE21540.1 preprotein translocase subunit SecG [Fusibacter sp. A1]RXV61949.1 preprotein translocase subunit SecG [Fusibacter sp. A1]